MSGSEISMDELIIHVDLSFRCGNVRVSATNALSVEAIRKFRSHGYESLVDASVAGLNAKLREHVEKFIEAQQPSPEGK